MDLRGKEMLGEMLTEELEGEREELNMIKSTVLCMKFSNFLKEILCEG